MPLTSILGALPYSVNCRPPNGPLVPYHRAHVRRLFGSRSWSHQRPVRRAIQRNEAAIQPRWNRGWPQVKKAIAEQRTLVFVDASGFYPLPMLTPTNAPVGETPIIRKYLTRDHLSVISGITPEGNECSQNTLSSSSWCYGWLFLHNNMLTL